MKHVSIALLGCGNVGRGFVELAGRERQRIRDRYGVDLEIVRILVRDLTRIRPGVDRRLLTTRALEVIDSDCDVVVELVGGVHTAGAFVRRAIANGRDVVTANKALLAAHGPELFEAAARQGLSIGFEASVCGGIPVVRALHRGLAGDSIESIRGIVNGTCNFVLSRMEEGLEFDDAVRAAQERGFAEADPSMDIDGHDSAQKIRILASLAFDAPVTHESIIGIRSVTREQIERAHAGGCVIRLVAEAERLPGGVTVRVRPREIDAANIFGTVRDEYNVVAIRGRATGEVVLTGKGAGPLPTAAAVLSDVIEIAQLRSARPVEVGRVGVRTPSSEAAPRLVAR
jgi:homoserine dehydrogenase